MTTKMSATEARVHFGEVLRRVQNNETIIVERGGKPKAVILSIPEYEKLKRRDTRRGFGESLRDELDKERR